MFDKDNTAFNDKVDIAGDLVQGGKNTIEQLIVNIYGDNASPIFSEQEMQDQLREYKRYLVETYKFLDFKGIDSIAEAVKGSSGITLESVYVPLRARLDTPDAETWHRLGGRLYRGSKAVGDADTEKREQETSRAEQTAMQAEQWINRQPALVVLGAGTVGRCHRRSDGSTANLRWWF